MKNFLILLVFFLPWWTTAQPLQPHHGIFSIKVDYNFLYEHSETDHGIHYELYLNDRYSLYRMLAINKKQQVSHSATGEISIREYPNSKNAAYYLTDLQSKQLLFRENIAFVNHYFEEIPPKIQWTVHNQTKKIGTHICKKATGKFRGRTYTAWFTEAIPTNAGPFKFHGLQGLTLEITEDTGYFSIKATKITTALRADLSSDIKLIKSHTKRSDMTTYQRLQKRMHEDRTNYMNSKIPKGSPKFILTPVDKRKFIEIFE